MGRLESKHTGGLNNEKGSQYESNYAVYKIAWYLSQMFKEDVTIKSQIEGAYVDDLLIIDNQCYNYFQLKNVKNLSWKDVESDFNEQRSLSMRNNEQFTLA